MARERGDRGSPSHRVGMIILVTENLFSAMPLFSVPYVNPSSSRAKILNLIPMAIDEEDQIFAACVATSQFLAYTLSLLK
ncbi:MAG: hypothetical protein A4E49_00308 [Methanosaeta sp. PtaU1.Bin112]|nr:MAG: hypothetical protein A4E49_00308 [Methanosaeta sp. PtaU1.Bin112]